jgi:hypothetical protein
MLKYVKTFLLKTNLKSFNVITLRLPHAKEITRDNLQSCGFSIMSTISNYFQIVAFRPDKVYDHVSSSELRTEPEYKDS